MIRAMQEQHKRWLNHNFPNQLPHDGLLGIMEEVGELSHAHLKHQQRIRGIDREKYIEMAEDALGDIFIYMLSYCNTNGLDLETIVEDTWTIVSARDWSVHPEDANERS